MSTVHRIATTTHGRYLVETPAATGPYPLLVGFHGYRENATIHLDILRAIVAQRPWIVVSVQALSRFYANGETEIVGAWMTRQDREHAITDNLAYVAAVVAAVRAAHATHDAVVYAGFSQGSAMAYRAAAFAAPRATGVIALAGDVPPDVRPVAATLPPVLIGRGTGDQWYTETVARADLEHLTGAGVAVSEHVFDGGHVWHPSFIQRASRFLDGLAPLAV